MSAATEDISTARRAHTVLDPLHAVTYLSSEAAVAFREAGLTGPWHGYFAGRTAPMGAVAPAVVTAVFYHFKSEFVASELTEAWSGCTPERALEARLAGVDNALRALLGEAVSGPEVAEAAVLAGEAAAACGSPGRPLSAANAALPLPDEPHLALWQAITTLREYRGDGHGIALSMANLDGVEALVTITAAGGERRHSIQARRGWTDAEWTAGELRLTERGLLDSGGALTTAGRGVRDEVEETTDRLASSPWRTLGERSTNHLLDLLEPLTKHVVAGLRERRPA